MGSQLWGRYCSLQRLYTMGRGLRADAKPGDLRLGSSAASTRNRLPCSWIDPRNGTAKTNHCMRGEAYQALVCCCIPLKGCENRAFRVPTRADDGLTDARFVYCSATAWLRAADCCLFEPTHSPALRSFAVRAAADRRPRCWQIESLGEGRTMA